MERRAGWWAAAVYAVAAAAGLLDLVVSTSRDSGYLDSNNAGGDLVAIGYGLAGAYVARRRPGNPIGWVLLAVAGAQGVTAICHLWVGFEDAPARLAAAWLGSWTWFVGFAPLPTVLVALYPTGRASPRRRRLIAASLLGTALVALSLALSASAADDLLPGAVNPVAVPAAAAVLGVTGALVLLPCALLSVGEAVRRLWRGRSPEREQLLWLLTTVVAAVGGSYLSLGLLGLLLHLLVPVGVAVGVVRHGLLDLQVVVRRTLLFAGLTAGVVVVFVVTTTVVGTSVQSGPLPVAVAAALVAVGLTPARTLLQRGVDRLVYGDRHDPLRAVASLGRDVSEHGGQLLVPQVLLSVAAAVRSPSVLLADPAGQVVSGTGTAAAEPLRLPLQVGGVDVGALLVSPRTPRDGWSREDRALLDVLARQVALVVHAERLNSRLMAARDDVLAAAAEERQRLRQELHDGLGPALSGIALGLEAAEASLQARPERAHGLLARLREETQVAATEVRRLVEGLRPAALEGRTLPDALGDLLEGLAATGRLEVEQRLQRPLPPLAPDVEAAAYRIVSESVTNAVRHSGARRCRVEVGVEEGALHLCVEDDGRGLPAQPRDGVGLMSMRRRAVELGGTWSAGPRDGGGTRVHVVLPVRAQVPA